MKLLLAGSLALAVVFGGAAALADAVPPPPKDCPPGSVPATGHAGPWCEPKSCQTDADCKQVRAQGGPLDGQCQSTALCVARRKITRHRRGDDELDVEGPATYERVEARTMCRAGGRCVDGLSCATEKRCVMPWSPPSPSPLPVETERRGCGCGKSTKPQTSALWGVLAGWWLLRRR